MKERGKGKDSTKLDPYRSGSGGKIRRLLPRKIREGKREEILSIRSKSYQFSLTPSPMRAGSCSRIFSTLRISNLIHPSGLIEAFIPIPFFATLCKSNDFIQL